MLLNSEAEPGRCTLSSPIAMPRACGFLWNPRMMIQVNCQGYATAQHMQPEPARYSHAPVVQAQTFMLPEQSYYAHHPGRFVYVRDEADGALFSVPHAPVCRQAETFEFSVGREDIRWRITNRGIEISLSLALPAEEAVELWSLRVRNISKQERRLSLYPFFTIGYMSWMNQSALYRPDLGGIVATCITPYQKIADYAPLGTLKDQTFLLHDTTPTAWETALDAFEGNGGLHAPQAIGASHLSCGDALYETPAAVLQYQIELATGAEREFRFLFGPACGDAEIIGLRNRYLSAAGFAKAKESYRGYLDAGSSCLHVKTPDRALDNFVNQWLNRQVYYHGDVNRLSTDPQTRNFLQDAMGMVYIQPAKTRRAFLQALTQQAASGAMPDGIRLHPKAELKFINQVPHSDHCVWLPVCLQAYLDETGDYAVLDEMVTGLDDGASVSVFERITLALRWLINDRDHRGLSHIGQGDWCDPMNMAGHKGKGVSGWLSVAVVYALNLWSKVCLDYGHEHVATEMLARSAEIATAVRKHLWDGNWFARGITDDDKLFGVSSDPEGRVFLNPQSWAMLAQISNPEQNQRMLEAVQEHLETPYGVMMLAPAYTAMREDIGRITQKSPGSSENGSVYNHAATFYIFALYSIGQPDHAYRLLRQMIPGPDEADLLQRGQLPVFIPNYYRGAWREHPRTAGRSSQLFNTGSASWFYRILIDGLFGVKGCDQGLQIIPQLPREWTEASITRDFRGARFEIQFRRKAGQRAIEIRVDGQALQGKVITQFSPGSSYTIEVCLPQAEA